MLALLAWWCWWFSIPTWGQKVGCACTPAWGSKGLASALFRVFLLLAAVGVWAGAPRSPGRAQGPPRFPFLAFGRLYVCLCQPTVHFVEHAVIAGAVNTPSLFSLHVAGYSITRPISGCLKLCRPRTLLPNGQPLECSTRWWQLHGAPKGAPRVTICGYSFRSTGPLPRRRAMAPKILGLVATTRRLRPQLFGFGGSEVLQSLLITGVRIRRLPAPRTSRISRSE